MPKLDLVSATSLKVSGGNVLKMKGVDFFWPPVRLSDFYGTGPGQIPIHVDMREPGGYTLGDDDGVSVVTGLTNFGGTGAYHSFAADGVDTAPRLDSDAMLFRVGDLMRMAHEAQLDGVHALLEVNLTNPGINETNYILSHSGGSAGARGAIQYMRHNANQRLRLQNLSNSQAVYATASSIIGAWRLLELRYTLDGTVYFAVDGTAYGPFAFPLGGDLYVNMLGATMRNQRIGAMLSIATDPAHDMDNPEPAVLLAREKLIGRRI